MSFEFYKAVRLQWMNGRRIAASLSSHFAAAICPSAYLPHLQKCESESRDFRAGVQRLTGQKIPAELDLLADFLEARDVFPSYSALMQFFAEEDQYGDEIVPEEDGGNGVVTWRMLCPQTHYLTRTAKRFMESFERLPGPVQTMLNKSLSMQTRLLITEIRAGCQESMDLPQPRL